MNYQSLLITASCVAAVALAPLSTFAQSPSPKPSASPKATASPKASASPAATTAAASPAAAKSQRAIPFRGTATAVDQTAKTFTIAGKSSSRVFKVTDQTTITKAGNPATFVDLTDNEAVTGSYWKHEDGTLEAKSLKIGGKTEAEKAKGSSKKSSKKAKGSEAEETTADE